MNKLSIVALCILTVAVAWAGSKEHKMSDEQYQDRICTEVGGSKNVRRGAMRVDCLGADYAVEIEHAENFKEGIQQAKRYSDKLKVAGCVHLIVERDYDIKYVKAAQDFIAKSKRFSQIKIVINDYRMLEI